MFIQGLHAKSNASENYMDIYNKILFLYGNELYDCVGNKAIKNSVSNIVPIAGSVDLLKEIPKNIDYGQFSIYIGSGNTIFHKCSERILRNSQKLEMIVFQILLNRTMTNSDFQIYDYYFMLLNHIKDGKLNGKQFDSEINKLKNQNEHTCRAVLLMDNLYALHNVILDELHHAEFRMIDCINSMIKVIVTENMRRELSAGEEMRCFSLDSDNAAFSIQDSVKAIYKSLDIIAKWLNFMKNYNNNKNKFVSSYFSEANNLIDKWRDCDLKSKTKSLFNRLEPLTSFRNEIIHNYSLNYTRQHIFVGRCTPCIDNANLMYSDILFWDYNGREVIRSNNRIGFFEGQKNALTETRTFFDLSIQFIDCCMMYYYNSLINDAKNSELKNLWIWNGIPDKLERVNVDSLEKLYLDVMS